MAPAQPSASAQGPDELKKAPSQPPPELKLPVKVFKGSEVSAHAHRPCCCTVLLAKVTWRRSALGCMQEVPLLLQVTESGQLRVKAAASPEEARQGFAQLLACPAALQAVNALLVRS